MASAALTVIFLAGLYLIVLSGLMWNRPGQCLRWLDLMASTWRINLTELGLRAVVGAAFVIRSDYSKAPAAFEIAGWFLTITAVLLMLVPRNWHHGYAAWWASRLPAGLVKASAPFTALAAAFMVYLAI